MPEKIYIEEKDLLLDCFRLGVQIYDSGFRPDFIVGLWRGGSYVGIVVQECLQHLGIETDHISLRTSYRGMESYNEMVTNHSNIRVHGTQYLLENLNADDKLLIVDDVFSTGLNVKAVLDRLAQRTKRNMPKDVRVASLWWKPANNQTQREPDYQVRETDRWLVFPYEMTGLSEDEITQNKPFLKPILDDIDQSLKSNSSK